MSVTFIDTHAHLYGEDYAEDLSQVLERARRAGAQKVFLPSVDLNSVLQVLDVAKDNVGFCYPMIGLHPEDLPDDYEAQLLCMEQMLEKENPFIAIGEVGLDYYWDSSKAELQRKVFERQIEWSIRFELPLMIHSRAAHSDLLDCLRHFSTDKLRGGVFHCFSGTLDEAHQLLEFPNFALGVGGIVTFKKSKLPEVLSQIPLERIVLETDAPYMAPVPMRGKRNESSFVPYIIQKLAEIYKVTPEVVSDVTTQNTLRIFSRAL